MSTNKEAQVAGQIAAETAKAADAALAGTVVSYTTVPKYEQVALLGKTVESASFAGTADRRSIKRTYITEAVGFDNTQVIVEGVDRKTGIRTVGAKETVTVSVRFVGASAHIPATWQLDGHVAASVENEGAEDLFIDASDEEMGKKLAQLVETALKVSANSPEYAGLWFVESVGTGKRVFPRLYAPVDKAGSVKAPDDEN